jgi:hypothetical protein
VNERFEELWSAEQKVRSEEAEVEAATDATEKRRAQSFLRSAQKKLQALQDELGIDEAIEYADYRHELIAATKAKQGSE